MEVARGQLHHRVEGDGEMGHVPQGYVHEVRVEAPEDRLLYARVVCMSVFFCMSA